MKFSPSQDGYITGLRFYKQPEQHGRPRRAPVDGRRPAAAPRRRSQNETASGWQEQSLPTPVPVTAGTDVRGLLPLARGSFRRSAPYFSSPVGRPPLTAPATATASTATARRRLPQRDLERDELLGRRRRSSRRRRRHTRAEGGAVTPADGATASPGATVDRHVRRGRSTPRRSRRERHAAQRARRERARDRRLRRSHAQGARSRRRAPLAYGTHATPPPSRAARRRRPTRPATRSPADDSWSSPRRAACPCTLFAPTTRRSATPSADSPVEVGMKFRSTRDGYITALRFYRQAGNVGPRDGHLWTATRPAAGRRHLPATRRRPAGRKRRSRDAVAITAGHDLRHVLLREHRPLRLQPRRFGAAHRPRPAARARPTSRRRQRRLQVRRLSGFPTETCERHQLLGRRRLLRERARRTRGRPASRPDARRRATGVPGQHQGQGHLRRADRPR